MTPTESKLIRWDDAGVDTLTIRIPMADVNAATGGAMQAQVNTMAEIVERMRGANETLRNENERLLCEVGNLRGASGPRAREQVNDSHKLLDAKPFALGESLVERVRRLLERNNGLSRLLAQAEERADNYEEACGAYKDANQILKERVAARDGYIEQLREQLAAKTQPAPLTDEFLVAIKRGLQRLGRLRGSM